MTCFPTKHNSDIILAPYLETIRSADENALFISLINGKIFKNPNVPEKTLLI